MNCCGVPRLSDVSLSVYQLVVGGLGTQVSLSVDGRLSLCPSVCPPVRGQRSVSEEPVWEPFKQKGDLISLLGITKLSSLKNGFANFLWC